MNGRVDVSAQGPALEALAVQVAAGPRAPAALGALGAEVLGLVATLAGTTASGADAGRAGTGVWTALVDPDGMTVVGPALQILAEGPSGAPRFVHVVVGERALTIQADGPMGRRIRLIDDSRVLGDVSIAATGESIDHLDAEALVGRVLERVGQVLDRRPDDAYEVGPDAGPVGVEAATATLGGRRLGRTLMTGAGVAAGAAAVRRAASKRAGAAGPAGDGPWVATHVVPAGGIDSWTVPDAATPATALAPGVPLALLQQAVDWAQVEAENGWRGWVDARRLVAIRRASQD